MKKLLIVAELTLFVLCEARPGTTYATYDTLRLYQRFGKMILLKSQQETQQLLFSKIKSVVTPKPVEIERSVEAEEKHLRVRRYFDYGDYMSQFWDKWDRCTECNVFNVGNGYKNRNEVHMGKRHKSRKLYNDMLNIGNGYKNLNTVFFDAGQNSPNQDPGVVNIGNGAKNTNTVFFGVKPGSINGDPFKGSFWND